MTSPVEKKRLGDLLLEERLIDKTQLQTALSEQKKWGGRLGKHLVDLGILSEEVLVKVLSKLMSLPSVDVGRLSIARSVLDLVPVKTAEKFNVMPIGVEEAPGGKKTIIVAMSDPTNLSALDELRFATGCGVRAVVSGDSGIERAIRVYYHGDQNPSSGSSRRVTIANAEADAPTENSSEMTIMSRGDSVRVGGIDALRAVAPQGSPVEIGSLPSGALTPAAAGEGGAEEQGRRLNALLRVLVRRKLMTEEEFLAELEKG